MIRSRGEQPVYEPIEKTEEVQPAMKIYPLETKEEGKKTMITERQRAVNPLSHFQNHTNMLGQKPPQAPPYMPQHAPQKMQAQTHTPAQARQSHPPENAVEQFKRVNKGLPDGAPAQAPAPIQSQPQAFGAHTPMIPLPPQTSEPSQTQQSKSLPTEAAEILEVLAQNERNAYVFYSHFAASKESFAVLAKDSKMRLEQYIALLQQFFKRIFVPQETVINKEISLPEAVALAISEENKGLVTLGNLSELAADTEAEKQIWRVINKKIIGQQLLLSIKL
jgi:hypothetical protein